MKNYLKDFNQKNKKSQGKIYWPTWFGLDEANKAIEKFILQSYSEGISKLRIVTGKGLHSQNYMIHISQNLGILRYSVPEFINNNKDLLDIIASLKMLILMMEVKGHFILF